GHKLLSEAIERAKIRNCGMIQLTSNKARSKAISFYKKLGFDKRKSLLMRYSG
ncbi:MAG: GNAT family N-acetyltransferase, partial [Desulfobacterales bacterium]|nr:GNAT family N-acetyltransferase [Desulfobacterales bacterium]